MVASSMSDPFCRQDASDRSARITAQLSLFGSILTA